MGNPLVVGMGGRTVIRAYDATGGPVMSAMSSNLQIPTSPQDGPAARAVGDL
jgi:hypothetical protein